MSDGDLWGNADFYGDRGIAYQFKTAESYSGSVRMMRKRRSAFSSKDEMVWAGIAADPLERQDFEDAIDTRAKKKVKFDPEGYDEVIVGGGLHAAIYAATRAQKKGVSRPLVLERNRIGGVFGNSIRPVFWLNSRNRPGMGGLPSENAALNYVPGAPLQMSHLSGLEFQSNADMAFVIRVTLAKNALVAQGCEVQGVEDEGSTRRYRLTLTDGRQVWADRVIDSRGLGDPRSIFSYDGLPIKGPGIMNFVEFMRHMDQPFPLQKMKRVAVLGGGDTGKCVVEALIGQGPAAHMSVAALDWVDQIDWYDQTLPLDCSTFRVVQRARYLGLSGALAQPTNATQRVRVFQQVGNVAPLTDGRVNVNGRSYDHVVTCIGWDRPNLFGYYESENNFPYSSDQPFAKQMESEQLYKIGPAANIPFNGYESANGTASRPENSVALFRYGWRTAAFAQSLT